MTLSLAGTFPVSAVNVGLASAVVALQTEVTKLGEEIVKFQAALLAQAEVAANIPDVATLTAAVAGQLNLAEVTSQFSNIVSASAEGNLDATAELGVVNGQILAVEGVLDPIEVGVSAPDIAGWSYRGRVDQFGPLLASSSTTGFGRFAASDVVTGMVVSTESLASWQSFSEGVDTGSSASAATADDAVLKFLGTRSGADWNTGTAGLLARLRLFLTELRAIKATLEAQLLVSLGANLPDPAVLVDVQVDVDALLGNLINVNVDLDGEISSIQARIDALIDLIGEIDAQLSAGGLSFWNYSGRADQLGPELAEALADGIPSGNGPDVPAYGLALVGSSGSMGSFGSIFGP